MLTSVTINGKVLLMEERTAVMVLQAMRGIDRSLEQVRQNIESAQRVTVSEQFAGWVKRASEIHEEESKALKEIFKVQ